MSIRAAWDAWKRAVGVIWDHLVRLIVVNLLWLVVSLPLITVGPATLAAYWWIATAARDEKPGEGYGSFFTAFRRLFWRGLVWSIGWVVVLALAYSNVMVWGRFLPPLATAVVDVLWVFGIVFLGAMQPYLLEDLAVEERPWRESLRRSAWHVMANPIYSHLHLIWPIAALFAAARTTTLVGLVLVSLVLTVMAVVADNRPWKHGEPPPFSRRMEDVL